MTLLDLIDQNTQWNEQDEQDAQIARAQRDILCARKYQKRFEDLTAREKLKIVDIWIGRKYRVNTDINIDITNKGERQ